MQEVRQWGKAGITLILVTGVGFLFDRVLFAEGVPRWEVILLANLAAGGFAAMLVMLLEERSLQRHNLVEERLRVIAEMNHHVRNALQVLLFHSAQAPNQEAVQEMKQSIDRIQWALREILPSLPER